MHSDEDMKDGRYFPSPKEQAILTQTIDQYFSLPERSEQRSIVVQNVTTKLSEINPRWTHRAVRLWFNNNKRTCLKSSVQFDPMQIQGADLSAERMPPKKRPPRSTSVGAFISRPMSPPADITIADNLASVFTAISQHRQSLDDKKILESDLTNRLIEVSGKLWADHIAPIEQIKFINAPGTIPGMLDQKSQLQPPSFDIIGKFNSLEAGMINKGSPIMVDFDYNQQKRTLFIQNAAIPVNFPFPTSSLNYDENTHKCYIASGNVVYQATGEGVDEAIKLIPGCPPMLRSSICSINDAVVLGNRKNIYLWSYDSINGNLPQNGPNCSHSFDSGLQTVTSITSVYSHIACASHNHHAIHILAPDGRAVRSFIGHGSGITCLSSYNKNDYIFVSGSADLTARVWDFREPVGPIWQLQRHLAPLTSVSTCNDNSSTYLVFTGGEDHFVRMWDLRIGKVVSEAYVGQGIPYAIDYNIQTRTLLVLTKEKNSTIAEGFQIPQSDDDTTRFIEKCLNLCIKYTII